MKSINKVIKKIICLLFKKSNEHFYLSFNIYVIQFINQ